MNNSQLSTHNSQLIPPGYKQTEVGAIPEDWDTPELGDVLKSIQLGGNYKNSERETSWPLIKMGNLGRGSIKLDKLEFIDPSQSPTSRDRLRKDDLLFNTRNTLDLVGKVALWRDELPEAFFNSNIMRMEFNETRVSSKRFMNYVLNTSQSLTKLRGIAIGTTSVAAIYGRDLVKVKVPLPTGTEQEAIAETLSDADALIESLEQLLAKKRQLKQGAMQELLTGKKRLPGFSGKWEVKQLGDIIEKFVGGGTPSRSNSKYWGSEIPWVTVKDFATFNPSHSQEAITRVGLQNSATHLIPKGTLITSTRMALGKAVIYDVDVAINQDLKAIFPKPVLVTQYLYFWFQYHEQSIDELGSGSTVKGISLPDIKKIEFQLPPSAEQTAIASILSDMDAEIASLEAKLAKSRQLKQGMMQELLTGRIRLV